MPSGKSLALIWRTKRFDKNENVVIKKQNQKRRKRRTCKMMNRFQFRAPPPNPVLNAGSGKSGLGATTINKPKPRPPPSEDLWGDLDDDFLVQASQVAEQLQQAHAASVVTEEERMEMDEEVLTMFIQEEEKLESLPPPRKPAPPKPVRLYAEPVKPQPKVRFAISMYL